ncbi:MAG TPA: hypothetical protein VI566_08150 [Xanthomonadales bacterium]|nr:hypothetical protein [Xanthomonadales bacterium]
MKLNVVNPGRLFSISVLALMLPVMATAQTPSDCVEQGALAYDNWTKTDAGGSGTPTGEANGDYYRCKSCHGWDRLGTDGGYVRRSRTASRPNAGAGDGDATSREIVSGAATSDKILHNGSGRSYADGTGSWVALNPMPMHSAQNTAGHENGYTLGNQHPDFSTGGPNAGDKLPTAEQLTCLAEFLNYADAEWNAYFSAIYPEQNPVLYTIVETADAVAGEAFYDTCEGCHDAPAGEILPYLAQDGKYSELAHKARWGIPNTEMTREALGDPSSADIANLLLYLQQLGGTGFAMNAGLSGNWFNADRSGEGFNLEVSKQPNNNVLVAQFYTYNDSGDQVWLVGDGPVNGDSAEVTVYITDDALWGDDFDPDDVDLEVWGSGLFVANSCGSISMSLAPNSTYQSRGFTDLEYDLVRVTTPAVDCPSPPQSN